MSRIEDVKGFIDFPSGFKLLAPSAVDSRFAGEDEDFLSSIVEANAAYPGLKVYIKSTNKFYSYTKNSEGGYSFQLDSVSLTPEQQAALDSGITSEKVAEIESKYVKPEAGIPLSDLAPEVENKITEVASQKAKEVSDNMESRIRTASDTALNALTKATTAEAAANSAIQKNSEQEASIAKIKEDVSKLPTEEDVLSLISKNSGRQLSSDAAGNGFQDLNKLFSGPWYYNGTQLLASQLNEGDQAYILASEGVTSKTMVYTGSGWATAAECAYQFSEAEQDALESGITKEKVSQIETNKQEILKETSRATQAESDIQSQAAADSTNKVESHNTSSTAHSDIRAEISSTKSLAEEGKTLAEEGISKADAAQETANQGISKADLAQQSADAAKTSATEAKDMVNSLEGRVNTNLAGKQPSLPGGGDSNTNILLQPTTVGGNPQTLPKAELISEIETQKITPVKTELEAKIKAVEDKNIEQDSKHTELEGLIQAAQSAADAAQQTADSKVGSVSEGTADGTISVDGTDVNVHGLKQLAFKDGLTKSEVGLGNVDNVKQATKEEFDSLKTKVDSLEKLGQFVGSYATYKSLPETISEISENFGVSATINDFATVRSGPYGEDGASVGLIDTDVTCWSIMNIVDGVPIWKYEYTLDKDITGKIDKVRNSSGKVAIFKEDGNVEGFTKTAQEMVNDTATAKSAADAAQQSADAAQASANAAQSTADSKYPKPSTGIPKDDLAQGVKDSLDKADTSVYELGQSGGGTVGSFYYKTRDGQDKEVQVGGLGNLAGRNISNETKGLEGTLKQRVNGSLTEFEIDSPFIGIAKAGTSLEITPLGFDDKPTLAWENDIDAYGEYRLIIPQATTGNKGRLESGLFLPKVRTFIIKSSDGLEEVFGLAGVNQTNGNITIRSNYKVDLVVIVE